MERIQKRIAASGIASRRKAEELILEGRVKVNGLVVSNLGTKVGPKDEVTVDDVVVVPVPPQPTKPATTTKLNKPFNKFFISKNSSLVIIYPFIIYLFCVNYKCKLL